MTEDQLQAKCFQWAWNRYPATRLCLWTIPNGGDRRFLDAVKFKATGVIAGVHDMHLIWKDKFYTFELKVGKNTQSPEQIRWGAAVKLQGAIIHEVREFSDFVQIFEKIILP